MNQNSTGVPSNQLNFEHYYNQSQIQLSNAIASLTQQEQYLVQKIKYLEHLRNKKVLEENQEIEVLKQRINELEQEQANKDKLKRKQGNHFQIGLLFQRESESNNNMDIEEIEQTIPEEKPFEEREEIINQTITDLLGNQAYFSLPSNLAEGKIVNLLDYM